jgi:hypothetical protein
MKLPFNNCKENRNDVKASINMDLNNYSFYECLVVKIQNTKRASNLSASALVLFASLRSFSVVSNRLRSTIAWSENNNQEPVCENTILVICPYVAFSFSKKIMECDC